MRSAGTPASIEDLPNHIVVGYGETAAPEIKDINWLLETTRLSVEEVAAAGQLAEDLPGVDMGAVVGGVAAVDPEVHGHGAVA